MVNIDSLGDADGDLVMADQMGENGMDVTRI